MLKDTESEVHTSRMIDKLRDSYNALNKTKKIDEKATQQTQPVQT